MSANPSEFTEEDQPVVDEFHEEDEPKGSTVNRFTRWRRSRPFTAGLFMILSGIVMLVPAYLSFEVSNIQIQISTLSGVSTALLGILLITCGISTWTRQDGRILTGVASMVLGIVALPAANFGGFVLGTLLALIGGALALSWAPDERLSRKERKNLKNSESEEFEEDDAEYTEDTAYSEGDTTEYADADATASGDESADAKPNTATAHAYKADVNDAAVDRNAETAEIDVDKNATTPPKNQGGWKHGGATTIIAVLTALAVGAGTHLSNAEAQLPNFQPPNLNDLLPQAPNQQNNQKPSGTAAPTTTQNQPAPAIPGLPQIPGMPALPKLPELPKLPNPQDAAGSGLPKEFQNLALPKIGGLDTDPPAPIPGMALPSGSTYTVKSDKTSLIGNVKLSYITLDTVEGPKPAIRIDADRVVLDNLRVRFPADQPGEVDIWQRSGPGKISTLNGNFHIIVAALDVTPQLAGVPLPFNVPINAGDIPENVGKELKKIGAGLPDVISDQTVMLNGTMETYYISADDLVGAPGTTISP